MNDFIILLIELFRQHKFWFLGSLIILQNNGIPLGSNLIVMAAGTLAYYGELNLPVLWGFTWFFSLVGDSLSYCIWQYVGKHFLLRFPRVNHVVTPGLQRAENYHSRYGKLTIILSRFPLSALGTFVNISAGTSDFRFSIFFLAAAVGELLWSSFYVGLGYWFADSWEQIALLVSQFGQLGCLILFLILATYVAKKLLLKKKIRTKRKHKKI